MQRAIRFWFILVVYLRYVSSYGLQRPVAFYPLRRPFNTSDTSCHDNQAGTPKGVRLVASDFGGPADTSYEFDGTSQSSISIPQQPSTDTNQSISILVWIKHTGTAGPILSYINKEFKLGFGLWMTLPDTLTAKFEDRNGSPKKSLSINRDNLQLSWHYVGVSYDHITGKLTLWINGQAVKSKFYRRSSPATQGSLCMGACKGDKHYFRGQMSCLQIYNKALSEPEVKVAKKRCWSDKTSMSDCGTALSAISGGCGGHMTNLSGTFMSLGYPAGYPSALECRWTIEVPKEYQLRMRLTFKDFDAQETLSQCENYVLIYDGPNTWSDVLQKYCDPEDGPHPWLNASDSAFKVIFHCGDHGTRGGFFAEYQAIPIVEDASTDFSEHYTGVVIGVACAALFSVLSIITFSQARRSLRCHQSQRQLVPQSGSDEDSGVCQPGAPPPYWEVQRHPDLYPPTPSLGRSPMGSRAITPAGSPTHSPTSSPVLPRRSQYIPRIGTPIGMPIFSPRHGSPSSSRRTSYASQTISPLARNVLMSQTSTVSQGSRQVESDEDDEEPPPYSVDLAVNRVSVVSQCSQPAGNSFLDEEDPPAYSAVVDLGIVDEDFTPEPMRTDPDESPRVQTSSNESVPTSSDASRPVLTSSDASRQLPTSSDEAQRLSMSSIESRQVTVSLDDSRRGSMNSDESQRVIGQEPNGSRECVWTLRPHTQHTRTNELRENVRNSATNLCDTTDRGDMSGTDGARGTTNNSPTTETVAASESPWTLRQPDQHTSAARNHATRAEVRDDSAGETHSEGANRAGIVVRRAKHPQVELKITDRNSVTAALAPNILRGEESIV